MPQGGQHFDAVQHDAGVMTRGDQETAECDRAARLAAILNESIDPGHGSGSPV